MATNNPRKNLPHSDIFEYWKDKAILENGEVVEIREALNGNNKYQTIVDDWGEPCCWACDKPILTTYEENGNVVGDFSKIWNDVRVKKHLNRCHIIPRTKGGEDFPSNMFLMCPSCHTESPDTTNPYTFFRWVYDQRKTHSFGCLRFNILRDKIQERLTRRGLNVSPEEIAEVIGEEHLVYEKMAEYLSSHIETHEFHYAKSSILEGFIDWLLHTYVETCLEVG